MTGNFNDRPAPEGGNRVGAGGFGVVYRGCFNGADVAIKKLSCVSSEIQQKALTRALFDYVHLDLRSKHSFLATATITS